MPSSRPLVLVTRPIPTDWLSSLEKSCEVFVGLLSEAETQARLAEAEGLFSLLIDRVDEALLQKMPRVRVVSNMAVGVDNVDLAACTRRGIPVGNTPGVLTDATADLTMALLLTAARRLPEANADARAGRWGLWSPTAWLGADLRGATLGIIGLGKIGQAVAARAVGFGLRLVYAARSAKPEAEAKWGAVRLPLPDLLRQSDFVITLVPLNSETRGLIGENELRAMKPSAIFINAARGPIVDTAALQRALSENWIAGAALDVTDPEPLPPDHPLYTLPNCFIAPHIGSATRGTRRGMAELACQNLLAGLEGKPLLHCANPEVYGSDS